MDGFELQRAGVEDERALCDVFMNHISSHPEYISHGEIQMGVGEGYMDEDGVFRARLAPKAVHFWMKYIHGCLTDAQTSAVFKAVGPDGDILGFCVAEIQEDGADPFGMVCDVLVKESCRRAGVGSSLLAKAIEWLRSMGVDDIYLESGLNNHAAHEYFMRRGFVKVSEIYRLQ